MGQKVLSKYRVAKLLSVEFLTLNWLGSNQPKTVTVENVLSSSRALALLRNGERPGGGK